MAGGIDKYKWWKEAVVYQIYPASFLDSNGDGWGDVPGITSKVDYLKELGVDVVWTSPIYKSPQVDMGYDISDYKDIDPRYGTLAEVDHLIAELKKRDMKLMMDLVVNHTSDQHAWFLESCSSRTSPKRDWYIWKDAKVAADGTRTPPNNWSMILGDANSAWTWHEPTQQYYLSLFTSEQPDLNWEKTEVRAAVHDVLRFWLERGVAGFRMDVINLISKDQAFPDGAIVAPDQAYQTGDAHFANGPRLHEYLHELHHEVLRHYDTITVGEMPFVRDADEILKVVGPDREELNMIFIFELVDVDNEPGGSRLTLHPWKGRDIGRIMSTYQRMMLDLNGWNSIFCENHDNPRSVSRYTDDGPATRALGSKLLCLMCTTLAGTLYVFQGQEIGMRNMPESWGIEEYKDIESINYWKKCQEQHASSPAALAHAFDILRRKSRDSARTPVQWTADAPHAGFTTHAATPWMRVNDDFAEVNVAGQLAAPAWPADDVSVLGFWQRCLAGRKALKDAFVYGEFRQLSPHCDDVFAYVRWSEAAEVAWLVVLNFSGATVMWDGLEKDVRVEAWAAGNYDSAVLAAKALEGPIELRPWEGLLGRCPKM